MSTIIYQDLGLNSIINKISDFNDKKVEIGFFNSKIAKIAMFQEFGTKRGIPESPFLRSSLKNKSLNSLKIVIAKELKSFFVSKDSDLFFNKVGIHQQQSIIDSIINKSWEKYTPNKKSTEKRKGFNHRLIDKGNLVNSIEYKVI